MIEFSEFKRQVCNFYRQHKDLVYLVYVNTSYQNCHLVVDFRTDNVKVVYTYKYVGYSNKDEQREIKKLEKLMREIGKDLKGIENEQN